MPKLALPFRKARGPQQFAGAGVSARDVREIVARMSGDTRDWDLGADGKPLPRPQEWIYSQFGPDFPLGNEPLDRPRPDTGQPDPRIYQYPVAWNLRYFDDRPVDWEILKKAADSPLFRACIELRKTEIATLDWTFTVDNVTVEQIARQNRQNSADVARDLREKYRDQIQKLNEFWSVPDRKNGRRFEEWIALLLEEQLVWDALAIYPHKTYGGELLGFWILDGSTIKPLLDETGGRPEPPAPAFQQVLYGFPRGEFTADTIDREGQLLVPNGYAATNLVYERRTHRTRSPYGFSPTEQALLHGMLYNARFRWMLGEYSDGTSLRTYFENHDPGASGWTAQQILEYERLYNNRNAGQSAERYRTQIAPPGYQVKFGPETAERYKADYDLHLIKLVAMHYRETITELGFTETGGLGSAGYHEGQEDIQFRKARLPDIRYAERLISELSRRFLGAPPEVAFKFLGLEQEDEAAAEAVVDSKSRGARMTLNEARADDGRPPFDFPEADMPMLQTARGVVFLDGASKAVPGGVLIEPASEHSDLNEDEMAGNASPTQRRPIQSGGGTAQAKKELLAYKAWRGKRGGKASRPFQFEHLTKDLAEELAPDVLEDENVVFKAGGAGPKASSNSSSSSSSQRFSPYSQQG